MLGFGFLLLNIQVLKDFVPHTACAVNNCLKPPFYVMLLNISLVHVGNICRCFILFLLCRNKHIMLQFACRGSFVKERRERLREK